MKTPEQRITMLENQSFRIRVILTVICGYILAHIWGFVK